MEKKPCSIAKNLDNLTLNFKGDNQGSITQSLSHVALFTLAMGLAQ
jgi:hypothetical protein